MRRTILDMHLHTRGSDGVSFGVDIVRSAVERGLSGFCVTDHHKTQTAEGLKVVELARSNGLRVFRGCEYTTLQGHLLIYGVDVEELTLGYYPDMQATIDVVNAAGGVAVPAHPYKGYKTLLGDGVRKLRGVRAYETVNGACQRSQPSVNKLAAKAARERGKLGLGGSDAHRASDVGLAYTVFHGDIRTERDLVAALRRGHYRAVLDKSHPALDTRKVAGQIPRDERPTASSEATETHARRIDFDPDFRDYWHGYTDSGGFRH